jgi:transcriptional regulator with XRE-family HTH domain
MKAKTKSWKQIEKKLFTREEIAEAERFAEREVLEMNLRELRQAAGKTQEQVARAAKMKQSELSRAERMGLYVRLEREGWRRIREALGLALGDDARRRSGGLDGYFASGPVNLRIQSPWFLFVT